MSLKAHLKIMICVKGNILFHCSVGNDFPHRVGRYKLIKRTKVLYSSAHISQLWRISLITLDASCTVSSQPRASTLNQNSSVNIHDSTSKHKVLITPTWEWPLSICKSFKWKNLPREWYQDLCNALAHSWSFFGEALCLTTTSPLSQSALHYLHVYD